MVSKYWLSVSLISIVLLFNNSYIVSKFEQLAAPMRFCLTEIIITPQYVSQSYHSHNNGLVHFTCPMSMVKVSN